MKNKKPDFVCPNCGSIVPGKAKACPFCGSDEETGWASNAEFSYLDPTFEEDDYEELRKTEFGIKSRKKPFEIIIPVVSLILILLWIYYAF